MRSALILAGGYSTRFGEPDKAFVPVDGRPMIERVADRVAPVADELVVNCRPEQRRPVERALDAHTFRFAVDPVPDQGPVAGLRTGLRVTRGQAVAVVACDMPRVDPALFETLFDACEGAAVPRSGDRLQPLHAVYEPSVTRVAAERTFATGSRRLYDVVARLDPVVVDVGDHPEVDAEAFADVDRPRDLPDEAADVAG